MSGDCGVWPEGCSLTHGGTPWLDKAKKSKSDKKEFFHPTLLNHSALVTSEIELPAGNLATEDLWRSLALFCDTFPTTICKEQHTGTCKSPLDCGGVHFSCLPAGLLPQIPDTFTAATADFMAAPSDLTLPPAVSTLDPSSPGEVTLPTRPTVEATLVNHTRVSVVQAEVGE